jgi:tRNA-specific 2-thiouridylase
MNKPRVVVAMSGGVDSSVAAALLKHQGFDIIGLMLRLWSELGSEETNRCCTPAAMAHARRVAAMLDIPFYVIDAQKEFHAQVVQVFIDGYAQGLTPNPCLICNRQVRWTFLLQHALNLGADLLATGHYARVYHEKSGIYTLLKATDYSKDQSYVLHVLDQQRLARALFPLGEYTKPEVRQLARDFNLPVADRAESQDLCFLGDGDYRDFLQRHAPQVNHPGPILAENGRLLGKHQGIAFYTIGQRKGLGVASQEPLYVIEKDMLRNALIVGNKSSLGKSQLHAREANWLSGNPPEHEFRGQVKIRYKAQEAWATIIPLDNGGIDIFFDEPMRDITPGQAAVIYQGDVCLGGGIIYSSTGFI